MPDYEISEDLLEDIGEETGMAVDEFSSGGQIDTEALSNEQLAYLSMNPEYMQQIMSDLGITDAGDYTQFVNAYDPWKQDLAMKQWELGKSKLMESTRQGLMSKLGDPLKFSGQAAKSGFEGMGSDQGGYLKTLEGLNIEGATKQFEHGIQQGTLGRDEMIAQNFQDYTDMLYGDIGDIYSQQQQAKQSGGGKK